MKCPSCGFNNIAGDDECAECHEDLASLDGVTPKSKMQRVLMSDPLARLAPHPPLFLSAKATLLQAVKTMNAAKVGSVLVGDADHLEGILTERDISLKAVCAGLDLEKTEVSALMTPSPETLTDEDSLAFAVNKMSVGGYRHIPILKDGRAAGIISIRDVLGYLSKLFPS
ncbi:MAG TPA: CBS domain-containing protein [bacterium]|nr:CBS domain-containing protein [bacterium]